jgi:hypothetical protein
MKLRPELEPVPCTDCGVDLQHGLIEIRTGVTTTHIWRANRFIRPDEWYLALDEADAAETLRWVCRRCGVQLPDGLALHLGRIINGAMEGGKGETVLRLRHQLGKFLEPFFSKLGVDVAAIDTGQGRSAENLIPEGELLGQWGTQGFDEGLAGVPQLPLAGFQISSGKVARAIDRRSGRRCGSGHRFQR